MKDIKFKIFASALASVLLVGCNDLDTEPLGAVSVYMAMPYPLLLDTTTSVMVQLC